MPFMEGEKFAEYKSFNHVREYGSEVGRYKLGVKN